MSRDSILQSPFDSPQDLHAAGTQCIEHRSSYAVVHSSPMEENGLTGVAGRRIVRLGINSDIDSLNLVGRGVHVEVADAIGMTHYGDLGFVLGNEIRAVSKYRNFLGL
jgi:hypothetical protein